MGAVRLLRYIYIYIYLVPGVDGETLVDVHPCSWVAMPLLVLMSLVVVVERAREKWGYLSMHETQER